MRCTGKQSRSRGAFARVQVLPKRFPKTSQTKEGRRSADRRIHPCPRHTSACCQANVLGRGCAPHSQMLPPESASGALASRRSDRGSRQRPEGPLAQLQAMLPGTRILVGVTRLGLSQSRDCTSRTGRSTGVNDARSRPGAECKSARRNRTRSAFRCASRTRPLDERDGRYVAEKGTKVKAGVSVNATQKRGDYAGLDITGKSPLWGKHFFGASSLTGRFRRGDKKKPPDGGSCAAFHHSSNS